MKTTIRFSVAAICSFAVLALNGTAFGQLTDTQTYTVTVPQAISVVAPTAATLNHDLTANPQSFAAQTWVVRGNSTTGVAINFAVSDVFIHTVDGSFKRDVKLALATGATQGPATWTITTSSDVTDLATGDLDATVTASSDDVGRADMALTVTFVTGDIGTLLEGDYLATVTGTVAANP